MKWLILILGILSNAFASVLVKYGGNKLQIGELAQEPLKIFGNFPLITGIFFYFLAFVLYIWALKLFPLHIAHPILTSGAIALVALCSFLIFHEPITLCKIFGLSLIILGVVLLTIG